MWKTLLIAVGIILAMGITVVVLGGWMNAPGVLPPQPIAFNHRLHLERIQGVQCQNCHQFVTSKTYAGLPSRFVCFDCHDPEPDESDTEADLRKPQFAALAKFVNSEGDIPWHRVTSLREDVFFSHRRHVTVAQLECRTCHPNMPNRTSPLTRGPIKMKMATCIGCHEKSNASVDCVSCHR